MLDGDAPAGNWCTWTSSANYSDGSQLCDEALRGDGGLPVRLTCGDRLSADFGVTTCAATNRDNKHRVWVAQKGALLPPMLHHRVYLLELFDSLFDCSRLFELFDSLLLLNDLGLECRDLEQQKIRGGAALVPLALRTHAVKVNEYNCVNSALSYDSELSPRERCEQDCRPSLSKERNQTAIIARDGTKQSVLECKAVVVSLSRQNIPTHTRTTGCH